MCHVIVYDAGLYSMRLFFSAAALARESCGRAYMTHLLNTGIFTREAVDLWCLLLFTVETTQTDLALENRVH